MMGWRGLRLGGSFCCGGREEDFFFEKKKQKTFTSLGSLYPERLGPGFKSFLLLFFKKEVLFCPAPRMNP
jgi:hypothetical protein